MSMSGSLDNDEVRVGNGVRIPFHAEGESAKVLVMLHGMNSHSGTWRQNLPKLAEGRRVIAPSLPPSYQGRIPTAVYVEHLEGLLDRLKVERVSLLGNSMGGSVAISFAAKNPHKISALLLEDSAMPRPADEAQKMIYRIAEAGIPSMVIWGEHDTVIPLDVGRWLASFLGRCEFSMVKGVGHVPHWEAPAEFNTLVEGFLSRHGL